MGKRDELSATMAEVLGECIRNGGELIRMQGGFWTIQGCPRRAHGAQTISALVDRGRMEYVEWKEGRQYRFPIRVRATEETANGN